VGWWGGGVGWGARVVLAVVLAVFLPDCLLAVVLAVVLADAERAGMGRTCGLPPAERALRSHARHSTGAKCRPSPPPDASGATAAQRRNGEWRTAGSETGTFAMVHTVHHTCSFSYPRLENSLRDPENH